MAKLVEMVRNSPLMRRRAGGYQVLDSEARDPFAQGIDYSAHYLATVEVQSKQDSPEVQQKVGEACSETKRATKSLRKVLITVKATTLHVKDIGTGISDEYPIFLVAYCGGHEDFDDIFFFIHKTKIDKRLYAEVFKLTDAQKVKIVTVTVAKAFNIAYKAWMTEKRQKERSNHRGTESPLTQAKHTSPGSSLAKLAPGVTKSAGPYTPPAPRKPAEQPEVGRQRSGSFGDSPKKSSQKNPAVVRVIAKNEKTGSTHNVTLTDLDEFDRAFQELAETRTRPDVLRTSLAVDETDHFDMEEIRAYIDGQDGAAKDRN